MQSSTVIVGLLAAGVAIALIASIGGFTTIAQSQSNSNRENDEEMKSLMKEMKEMKSMMSTMMEKMDRMMNMMMGDMMQGDMMGNGMDDMMNQGPLDVIIKLKSDYKVPVGKEAEIVLLVLDKETEEPLEGVEVLIGIERGPSMGTMDMMGDRKSTRLNSSHIQKSRMPSSA